LYRRFFPRTQPATAPAAGPPAYDSRRPGVRQGAAGAKSPAAAMTTRDRAARMQPRGCAAVAFVRGFV